ncbi:endoplasmic reticulum aminopeptidase 1-like isoform X1 [Orbicella faveolata]|uniref:endoplasmic reticulum aminopeptidase 1-like isoform X1 n=1 Tax=Orbicella faveolata TaxID=48498 RepID=UPI0009E26DA0|nr:endoplasmic reticulum aminopeptidase 1-like isoform X1 [Orbicella faveolata]
MQISYRNMESDHREESDSSSVEFEDHINISLLPDKKRYRKNRFGGPNFALKLREMFGGKTTIYGVVTALLLISVLLLLVLARPSSSHETVNSDSRKISRHDFGQARDAALAKKEVNAQESNSLRLPRHISPIEYLVYLHPNLTTFQVSGKVDVLLYCNEAANNITLHVGNNISYFNVAVGEVADLNNPDSNVVPIEVTGISRLHGEMLSITLGSELQGGKFYFLIIEFNSELSRGLSGFYLSKYTTKSGEERYLATTHFEPTDARNAFPCFDEPNMKAKFSIVITREKRHVALANMPVQHTEGCGDASELCTDHFQKSVNMSTYLVAFVVCDFTNISDVTSRGVKVSVWAPTEQIEQGQFALEVGVKVLSYYETIFNVDYPLPKQDLIAIPDFAAGAMENWGLITYRLTSLLYDENKSSDSNKQWVAVVVAHELAHQWFGNLVTMEWWNDLWLNEGFASFMENVGVDHIHPEWKMMDQFFLDKFQVSTALDQLTNSHPIMAEVKDPAQINSLFDSISYDKGAAIIRMLEDVLGRDVFFQGLQHYLQTYKFSNAETNDLWRCLTEQIQSGQHGGSGLDVTEMMTTWTSQMGFPVMTVKKDGNDPKIVHVTQKHFLVHGDMQSPSVDELLWVVPLTYVTEVSEQRHAVLIKHRSEQIRLPHAISGNSWIKMNAGQSGFYRVNYESENWNKLIHQLNTHHQRLSGADRAGLLDDAFNLARSGMLSDEVALSLTPYLKQEREYVPWMSALNNMAYFATQFSTYDTLNGSTEYYPKYKRYILHLVKDVANELGWVEAVTDPHLKRYLRGTVLHLATEYEDVLPREERTNTPLALDLFDGWLGHGASITPNLRNIVYSTGVKYADEATWDEVFGKFESEAVPSEKRKLMYALTNSRNKEILSRLLTYSLKKTKIRSQDTVAVINSVAHNPEGRLLAWKFVQDNYEKLYHRYGTGSFDFSRLIKATTAHFNTEEMKTQVKKFFESKRVGSGKLAVKQSLESIDANIKWIRDHSATVVSWLDSFPSVTARRHFQATYYDEIYKYGRP